MTQTLALGVRLNQMEQYQRDNVRLKAKCQLLTLVTNNYEMSLTLSSMGTIGFFALSPLLSASVPQTGRRSWSHPISKGDFLRGMPPICLANTPPVVPRSAESAASVPMSRLKTASHFLSIASVHQTSHGA